MTSYTGKPMTQWEFASKGGKARAEKHKSKLSEWGKKGGRPKKNTKKMKVNRKNVAVNKD